MNLANFAECLRSAIVEGWSDFRERHPDESPYAFALIGGQSANYLGYAVATEQGLQRIAAKYDTIGYRYQAWEWENFDNRERLAVWLRWANPDDGWHYEDFPAQFGIQAKLQKLVETGALGVDADEFEEFCTDVLATMQLCREWRVSASNCVVGFTYGEDPRDFLRTATRANPYPLVRRLWCETWEADELDSKIKRA